MKSNGAGRVYVVPPGARKRLKLSALEFEAEAELDQRLRRQACCPAGGPLIALNDAEASWPSCVEASINKVDVVEDVEEVGLDAD